MSGFFHVTFSVPLQKNSLTIVDTLIALYVGLFSCDTHSDAHAGPDSRAGTHGLIALYVGLFSCDDD